MADTYAIWMGAKSISVQIRKWKEDEADTAIGEALATMEKAARNLVEACKRASVAVPSVAMDMLKKHILDELDKARLPNREDKQIVAVHFQHGLQKREKTELIRGRSPHYNKYVVVAYQQDNGANGERVLNPVREIHIGDSDDPGVNWDIAADLVCMWLSEYAERYGMEVEIPEQMRVIA